MVMPILLACRSREGAWIEIIVLTAGNEWTVVAPVRERGLKYLVVKREINGVASLP